VNAQLEELKRQAKILHDLLEDPQVGLISWWCAVADTCKLIEKIYHAENRL